MGVIKTQSEEGYPYSVAYNKNDKENLPANTLWTPMLLMRCHQADGKKWI